MEEKPFIWTDELAKRLFKLKFENEALFKSRKQPWSAFYKLLLEKGFPTEMTIDHVRKKWGYTYDMYRISKKAKNKSWKYYKLFDKHYGKQETLDKYEPWNDEWRLKLIICISEAKAMNLDNIMMWRTVERAIRCQELPIDCCVQDIKGLWHHIRVTFNRKHRLVLKKGKELSDWPLYDTMLEYCQKYEPDYLINLESQSGPTYIDHMKNDRFTRIKKEDVDNNDTENEFQWSKHLTESFIQIRLQHDWLFKQRKWAWNEMHKIMTEEYGFPKSLSPRDLGRKWAATYREYQKAVATNNKTWCYLNLFELYFGEMSTLTLNPLADWQEEWVFNLISARTDLEPVFRETKKFPNYGWCEVEKRLRTIGIPLDHSLLDLPEMWLHLIKTLRWKTKFANKGILNENWPYFEAMSRYNEVKEKYAIEKQNLEPLPDNHDYGEVANDDDFEDDMKLYDLKQRLQLKPKYEVDDSGQCRCCYNLEACVNIFNQKDQDGADVAHKLKVIGGIEVEKSDNLPSHICLNCLQDLENAYKFRRKCQEVDKELRGLARSIKVELVPLNIHDQHDTKDEDTLYTTTTEHSFQDTDDLDVTSNSILESDTTNSTLSTLKKQPKKILKEKVKMPMKKKKYMRYCYWKVCEICGKNTQNLLAHLDAHSTEKLYSCEICQKKFKFKSGLVIHRAVHDPTPKKTCEVCGKSFHIMAQYRRHFAYHANERKFGCETCGKRFNSIEILKVHNRTHTDERPYTCEECGKTFRTSGCVSRHKRIVHRNIKIKKRSIN